MSDTPGTEPAPPSCPNCGAPAPGRFCGDCGQRQDRRRLSERELLGDLADALFDVDSRLWRTVRGLTLRPGLVTRSYVEGQRQSWISPIRYFLVMVAVYFVVIGLVGFDPIDAYQQPIPAGANSDLVSAMKGLFALTKAHQQQLPLLTVPVLAVFLRVSFRRSGRNFAETLSFTLYLSGHQQLLLAMPMAVGTALLDTHSARWAIFGAFMACTIAYQAWAALAFFRIGGLSSIARSLAAFAGWLLFTMILSPVMLLLSLYLAQR